MLFSKSFLLSFIGLCVLEEQDTDEEVKEEKTSDEDEEDEEDRVDDAILKERAFV